jgi:hypothetical protein
VLAGSNVHDRFSRNALVLFDPAKRQVRRRIALPHSWAKNISRDPGGNLWIGFSGSLQTDDDRVQIYSPGGTLLKTLRTARGPEAGISFAAGRAFVTCSESGFSGSVVVVRLGTLEIEQRIPVKLPDGRPLLLVASAADDQHVVVSGLTSGPVEASYTVITTLDPRRLTMERQIPLGMHSSVWQILPYQGCFYLLNVASGSQPRPRAGDLFVLNPGRKPSVTRCTVAASPLWGAIEGNVLYAYHNPTWNSTSADPRRNLSVFHLQTGKTQSWDLPKGWDAGDLKLLNGQMLLTTWGSRNRADGIYRFDPTRGEVSLYMKVQDASRLLLP